MSAIIGPWPNAPKTAQTISMIRMGDWWSKGIHLRALCACGAERQVPSAAVLKLFGQEHSWREGFDNERIAKLLVCGTCKQKGRATVRVVRE